MENFIAGLKDDLNATAGGNVTYFVNGATPNRVFVASWNNVKFYNFSANNGNASFQIHLFEADSHIEIHLAEATDPDASAKTIGIENGDGTLGYSPAGRNNVGFSFGTGAPEAWAFYPSGGGPYTYAWTSSPAATITSPGSASTSATNLTTTTNFTVTVTGGACPLTRTVTVNTPPALSAAITPATAVICSGWCRYAYRRSCWWTRRHTRTNGCHRLASSLRVSLPDRRTLLVRGPCA